MQRIALIGPGAIGGTVAAWLAQNPALAVTVCVRTPFEPLEVETPEGRLTATPDLLTEPSRARPIDWVLSATKTYDVVAAAGWLPGLMGPHTRVAVLQNGVEHIERFAPYVRAPSIVPVVVDLPAERDGPGRTTRRSRRETTAWRAPALRSWTASSGPGVAPNSRTTIVILGASEGLGSCWADAVG